MTNFHFEKSLAVNFHAKAEANKIRAGYKDVDLIVMAFVRRCAEFTMTTTERMIALAESVRHVCVRDIPGAIVECGVWKGGSMMLAALVLRACKCERYIWLYDTFTGQPRPDDDEKDIWGNRQLPAWEKYLDIAGNYQGAKAGKKEVEGNMLATGINPVSFFLIEGRVEDTLPGNRPKEIAVLRLDTDWRKSTAHCLRHLYPRLSPGGLLILDDYGHLSGAREATDEYFATVENPPMLHRVDYSCRIAVKP